MIQQYTFHFDSNSCSGCKTCQTACKDKHNLDTGDAWRNVFEVSGGGWKKAGEAWVPDVFAYYLSLSCSHCENPICAEVCPAKALIKRDDGIVLLDSQKCLGCGYCSWVCPYNALQYNQNSGYMTKCTFCADEIDQGKPPVCVAACPMRALDFGSKDEMGLKHGRNQAYAPMPDTELTSPSLVIKPHHSTADNQEKLPVIRPSKKSSLKEWSLVLFTLLSQSAAGAFIVLGLLYIFYDSDIFNLFSEDWQTAVIFIGIITAGSMMVSLLHLGSPLKSYRSVFNIKNSWLSREIFFMLLFFAATAMIIASNRLGSGTFLQRYFMISFTMLSAVLFIYSMSRIYIMRTVPVWNSLWTAVSFFITAMLLGAISLGIFISTDQFLMSAGRTVQSSWIKPLAAFLVFFLILEIPVIWRQFGIVKQRMLDAGNKNIFLKQYQIQCRMRTVLISAAVIFFVVIYFVIRNPLNNAVNMTALIFWAILILAGEVLGRYFFYKSYSRYGI